MNKPIEKIVERVNKLRRIHKWDYERYGLEDDALRMKDMEHVLNIIDEEVGIYNNGWIPCSERLPEVDVAVLVTHQNGNVQMAQLSKTGNFVIYDEDCGFFSIPVIAWQPLPQSFDDK